MVTRVQSRDIGASGARFYTDPLAYPTFCTSKKIIKIGLYAAC